MHVSHDASSSMGMTPLWKMQTCSVPCWVCQSQSLWHCCLSLAGYHLDFEVPGALHISFWSFAHGAHKSLMGTDLPEMHTRKHSQKHCSYSRRLGRMIAIHLELGFSLLNVRSLSIPNRTQAPSLIHMSRKLRFLKVGNAHATELRLCLPYTCIL